MKKVFDRVLHELQYLDRKHPHHFTLDLDQLDKIFVLDLLRVRATPFPATSIELKLENIFDTLDFLWLHHDSPSIFATSLG